MRLEDFVDISRVIRLGKCRVPLYGGNLRGSIRREVLLGFEGMISCREGDVFQLNILRLLIVRNV